MALDEIVAYYRNGDRSYRDIIIKELMPVAFDIGRILGNVFGLRGFRASELVAEAYSILVELVDTADVDLNDNNIEGYIRFYLPRKLKDFLWEDNVVVVPSSTHKLNKVERAKIEPIFEQYRVSHDDVRDTLEEIDTIIKTEQERKFVNLRMAGYQSNEIAEMIGMSTVDVSRLRSGLRRRYNLLKGLETC